MNVHTLITCVRYSDMLASSIARWCASAASVTVVTDLMDADTASLAREHGCRLLQTDVFYAGGAHFNKSAAMNEAIAELPRDGWYLFADADVIPPEDWLQQLIDAKPKTDTLHGAKRVDEQGEPVDDRELAGFFMLFHWSDHRAQDRPLLQGFSSAGCYDSVFQARWPRHQKRILGLTLTHLGEPGVNWCGRDNADAMADLRMERRRLGGWRHERIP